MISISYESPAYIIKRKETKREQGLTPNDLGLLSRGAQQPQQQSASPLDSDSSRGGVDSPLSWVKIVESGG